MTPFFDTNIIVYAVSDSESRRDRAQFVIARGGVISAQVLNEFVNVLRKKLNLDWLSIGEAVAVMRSGLNKSVR